MKYSIFFVFLILLFGSLKIQAQYKNKYKLTDEDRTALEGIIVERYYVSDTSNVLDKDTTGGVLPIGSITYRIYVDMKPGYSLQLVYGNKKHLLCIKTTTTFFNNTYVSALTGFNIHEKEFNKNTVALDSWLTMGAACRLYTGIPLLDDKDGSVLKGRPSLGKADGFTNGTFPYFKQFNLDMNFFNQTKNDSVFSTNNGGWAAAGGVKGPNDDNKVLIAQLTTNGKLSFELNIQLGTPTGGMVKFVTGNPEESEIKFDELKYNN